MQRSIDRSEDVFAEYTVCVISVAVIMVVVKQCLFSYKCSLCRALQQKEYIAFLTL